MPQKMPKVSDTKRTISDNNQSYFRWLWIYWM